MSDFTTTFDKLLLCVQYLFGEHYPVPTGSCLSSSYLKHTYYLLGLSQVSKCMDVWCLFAGLGLSQDSKCMDVWWLWCLLAGCVCATRSQTLRWSVQSVTWRTTCCCSSTEPQPSVRTLAGSYCFLSPPLLCVNFMWHFYGRLLFLSPYRKIFLVSVLSPSRFKHQIDI